ncbi:hypothetical protein [Agrobacterium rosae]|uniref:BZIP domain-containing protein n=1 Tax=Agrobacterium rosae TaxID=1972867 RepID=A0AAW9FE10_9HYPH|nr:hypothetical protein [Agrobacterium rosae]MDX8301210.1 hypothetical protein [Agrobacterium rosae]
MPRPRLNLTPDERRERNRLQVNERQERKRFKEKEKKMNQKVAAEMAEIAELYELAGELLELPLSASIEVVAMWQRENRRPFPALFTDPRADHETSQAYYVRREKARKFGLIRFMAVDHVKNAGDRRRKATFNNNEAKEAAALGITVDAYRKRKTSARLTGKMEKIVADRAAA